ncbi:MAG: hypothetical protein PHW34_08435 [Hespellia sp.]|nr:hypothetical protein [Hespellia sp.]
MSEKKKVIISMCMTLLCFMVMVIRKDNSNAFADGIKAIFVLILSGGILSMLFTVISHRINLAVWEKETISKKFQKFEGIILVMLQVFFLISTLCGKEYITGFLAQTAACSLLLGKEVGEKIIKK